jgi:predicted phage terminase large subunit-like protein
MLDIYGQEYLNNPIDESVSYYRKSDFRPMTDEQRTLRKTYYAASDLAISESKRAAYSVIITGGMTDSGDLIIEDVRRGRWDGLQIIEEWFSVDTRYGLEALRVEEENIARALGSFVYKTMDERQHYLPLDTKAPTKDKDRRSQSMRARCRSGKVYIDMEAEWAPDLIEELIRYPKHPYKDQFDTFGWLGLMLDEMVTPMTDTEYDDFEYDTMREESQGFDGRDEMTGY